VDIDSDAIVVAAGLLLLLVIQAVSLEYRFRKQAEESDTRPEQDDVDVWQATYQNLPLKFYGGGAHHNFDYYYTRSSKVDVSSIDEIMQWLLGCEYVPDQEQFKVRDHWQHPSDFEETRKGDCEDFALWAWRKLVELGHDAEFMVGKWIHDGRAGTHAWVFLRLEGKEYVFESTGRGIDRILKGHSLVRDSYVPFASVDSQMRKKVYKGMLHWVMNND
jgi:hypothetical protein